MDIDQQMMQRCLEIARRGAGNVSPNPMVGALLTHRGHIVSEGAHLRLGSAHAEVNAIASLNDKTILSKCTLYVSLEPCCHFGKTPPCTELILRSGIKKVVVAALDPHSKVNGEGIATLRAQNVEVIVGVLEAEARELNRGFYSVHERQRPWVILKWAQTKDGFIARSDGTSKWISGEESRAVVHQWRAEEDAILIGRRTAELDNPELTVRHVAGRNPIRVVLDLQDALPPSLRMFDTSATTIVITTSRREDRGNIHFRPLDTTLSLAHGILAVLKGEYILSVIIEGGAKTLQTFIAEGAWDEARIFVANQSFKSGLASPQVDVPPDYHLHIGPDLLSYYRRKHN